MTIPSREETIQRTAKREKFEAWAATHNFRGTLGTRGSYSAPAIAWMGWQAGYDAALSQSANSPDRRAWIDSINLELSNLRDWANREAKLKEKAEAELSQSAERIKELEAVLQESQQMFEQILRRGDIMFAAYVKWKDRVADLLSESKSSTAQSAEIRR
jgi:hypothetical protein